jgi:outer membrane protein OmpA-like peptidoglycan-associated protein
LIKIRAMKFAIPPLLVALSLYGCASNPSSTSPSSSSPTTAAAPAPGASAPPTPAEQRTAAASTLAVERQWLASWFKGTPVVVAQRPDGAVVVDVPREFCFDPGHDTVKPALAAVLDKVAQSLRRTPVAELHLIAAPADANGAATFGVQRATRVYDYLRARGVATGRLAKPSAATGAAVQLRMEIPSPA